MSWKPVSDFSRVVLGNLQACLAGGNFNNGAGAGLFARNLNNARTNVNNSVGARPDCGFFPQISLRE
ncbi:TPA: hypothetical protein ACKFCW_002927 [Citrobacter farmeri]